MQFTKYEMETIVNYNEDEAEASIYTASKNVMRKLDNLCERYPDTYRCIDREDYQATYRCPKGYINFKKPRSAAQVEAARAAASKMNAERHPAQGVSSDAKNEVIGLPYQTGSIDNSAHSAVQKNKEAHNPTTDNADT